MESQFNNPKFSDVTLELVNPDGNHADIYAQKNILSENSDYFQTLFSSRFREARQNKITLEVPDIQMATDLIHWMYTEREPVPPEHTMQLAIMWLVVEEVPYPGPPGKFVHDPKYGDWTIKSEPTIQQQTRYRRPKTKSKPETKLRIAYDSMTPTSSIKRIEFIEDTEEKYYQVNIDIRREYMDKVEEYLELFPRLFDVHHFSKTFGTYYVQGDASDMTKVDLLTEIILTNNEFSPGDRQFINEQIFGDTLNLEIPVIAIRVYHKKKIPYPGPPVTFEYTRGEGDWSIGNVPPSTERSIAEKAIVRTINFISYDNNNNNAFIYNVRFYGSEDGSVFVAVSFGKTNRDIIKSYFKQFPGFINAVRWITNTNIRVDDQKYVKLIAEIILNNNIFEPKDKGFINKEIFGGTLALE